MYQPLSKRKILSVCIAASLLSHIISIVFLQTYSFSSPSPHISKAASCLASMDKVASDQILRESFREVSTPKTKSPTPTPQLEISNLPPLPCVIPPARAKPSPTLSSISSIAFNYEFKAEGQSLNFALPPIEPLNLFEYIPKDLIASAPPVASKQLSSLPILARAPMTLKSMPTPKRASLAPAPFASTLLDPTIPESAGAEKRALPQILAQLPDFPTLADLGAASYSEFFETEIFFAPLENEKGYIFALTLVPQPGLTLPKVRQHYSFLIDRSNSIQKERLSAVKNAVIAAMEELDLDDSFNIIAFDSKIEKLSPAPLPATKASLLAARKFLDQVHLGSFFSTANLTKPLLLTVPAALGVGEHSAILFSDGESLGKKGAQRELALDWTRYNNGRVSLFAIGVGGDPHLPTLDAAAAFNRGKVLVPPTKRGIKRKLLKLMKMIGHPVATNMTATALPRSSKVKIALFAKPHQMPSLYLNEPYVILGTIDKLDNFILFVQGQLKDRWLNIKKNVSFVSAKKGDSSLKAGLALQQAYSLYEKYLYDLNPDHLTEARALLEPHALQVAFQ